MLLRMLWLLLVWLSSLLFEVVVVAVYYAVGNDFCIFASVDDYVVVACVVVDVGGYCVVGAVFAVVALTMFFVT